MKTLNSLTTLTCEKDKDAHKKPKKERKEYNLLANWYELVFLHSPINTQIILHIKLINDYLW